VAPEASAHGLTHTLLKDFNLARPRASWAADWVPPRAFIKKAAVTRASIFGILIATMPVRTDFAAFLSSFQSQKFRALRPAQGAMLEAYNEFLAKSDIGIELPTGAGKTLIALLICELWRRENKKVAVLSANKTLARQMVLEAAALGVPAVLMEGPGRDIPGADKRAYHRANSIVTCPTFCTSRIVSVAQSTDKLTRRRRRRGGWKCGKPPLCCSGLQPGLILREEAFQPAVSTGIATRSSWVSRGTRS
jgi:hypothetical protein